MVRWFTTERTGVQTPSIKTFLYTIHLDQSPEQKNVESFKQGCILSRKLEGVFCGLLNPATVTKIQSIKENFILTILPF